MTTAEMEERLKKAFSDLSVQISDLSGNGGKVEMRLFSPAFEGLSRVQRHQAVMKVFSNELESGELHALTLKFENGRFPC